MWSWSAGTISLSGYIMIIVIVPLCILFFVYGILIDIIHYNSSDTLGQTSGACRIPVWECESVRVDACGWREWSSHAATSLPTARHHAPPLCTTLYHTHFHNLRPHFQLSISTLDAHVESTCDNDITSSIEHTTPALGDEKFCCSPHVTVLRLLIEA